MLVLSELIRRFYTMVVIEYLKRQKCRVRRSIVGNASPGEPGLGLLDMGLGVGAIVWLDGNMLKEIRSTVSSDA